MLPSKQNSYNITASLMKTTQCVESKMKIKIEAKGDIWCIEVTLSIKNESLPLQYMSEVGTPKKWSISRGWTQTPMGLGISNW